MSFTDLVRGASLRGGPAHLTPVTSLRLGRAVGTLWRRQGARSTTIVVGRTRGAAEVTVRDGLVAGLVAAGFVVADLGIVESDRFTGALKRGTLPPATGAGLWPVVGGVFVAATGDSLGVMLFERARPLVGPRLVAVARIADDGVFAAVAGGRLVGVDARVLPGQHDGVVDSDGDDVEGEAA